MQTAYLLIAAATAGWAFLFWLLRRRRAVPVRSGVIQLQGSETYDFEITGESHYQTELENIVGGRSEDGANHYASATLTPQPTNRFDNEAIRVWIDNCPVGYIRRQDTAALHKLLAGRSAECDAVIVGGWRREGSTGYFGVKLCLEWPPRRATQ